MCGRRLSSNGSIILARAASWRSLRSPVGGANTRPVSAPSVCRRARDRYHTPGAASAPRRQLRKAQTADPALI